MRPVGGPEVRRNVLVDGNNLAHRAYFAFVESRVKQGQPPLVSPGGFPVGVTYGFLSMLSSWLYDIASPTSMSVFFDGAPVRRLSLDPGYKAGRDAHGLRIGAAEAPVVSVGGKECRGELELTAEILTLLGCDVYHHPSEEADDLIASYIRSRPDEVHIIVSADLDFFQLLTNPRVVCYLPGVNGNRFFDAERSAQHWARLNHGKHPAVPPTHVRMFKALCGDTSDAIHGVERLRKRVAVPLCHHSSVDALYATDLPGFSASEKEKALACVDRIRTNYELVGMNDSIDVAAWLRPAASDPSSAKAAARDICQDQLKMGPLDLSSFRFGPRARPVPLSSPDWLADL